jgi:hypothetical protein
VRLARYVLVEKASLGRTVAPNLTPDVQTGSGSWTGNTEFWNAGSASHKNPKILTRGCL